MNRKFLLGIIVGSLAFTSLAQAGWKEWAAGSLLISTTPATWYAWHNENARLAAIGYIISACAATCGLLWWASQDKIDIDTLVDQILNLKSDIIKNNQTEEITLNLNKSGKKAEVIINKDANGNLCFSVTATTRKYSYGIVSEEGGDTEYFEIEESNRDGIKKALEVLFNRFGYPTKS